MTREDWNSHVAAVRASNPSIKHKQLMQVASKSYRGGSYYYTRALGKAALGVGAIAGAQAVGQQLEKKGKRFTANAGARLTGFASANAKVICPNPNCMMHKERNSPSQFIKRSASTWGQYEIIYCDVCGVVLGAFANSDRLMDGKPKFAK